MSSCQNSYNHARRERYICPLCNMGDGHERRSYNKRSGTDGNPRTSTSSSPSPDKPKEYASVFQRPTAFDKHINELHEKIFRSINSNEYICALCPCSTIAHRIPHCTARFSANTAGEKQTFLDHLRSHHAQVDPRSLNLYHHICPPTTPASYTDPVIRRVAESFL